MTANPTVKHLKKWFLWCLNKWIWLINTVVVYKVDRLSRSILDFHNMMKYFEKYGANFVSITQSFDTSTSMGKLTLNMLLSFAQFEREVSSERVRDKIRKIGSKSN